MKKLLSVCIILSAALLGTLTACSDDDKHTDGYPPGHVEVPEAILAQFQNDYPDAQNVEWEREGDYYAADFSTTRSASNTAWYGQGGHRDMVKYEIPFSQLPAPVAAAFAETEYGQDGSGWRADDEVDVLERRDGSETLYVIEAERGESEVDLYYTADGILVQEILDAAPDKDYGQYLPQSPDGSVQAWLDQRFPGYRLIDVEAEDGGLEVEFIYERRKYEAFFDGSGGQWLYYKTDLHYQGTEIPDVVRATVEASELMQQGAWVDDVEMYVVNADGVETTYFCFELETRFGNDRDLYVRADGVEERPELGGGTQGGGVPVGTEVETFIEQRYPGAVILERDYDDGYLEVEIRHDGLEKDVKFNGRNEWVRTEWETRTLPDTVRQAVEAAGYRISDHEYERVETPDRNWYEVEAVKDRREWELCVADDGTILSERYDD